MAELGIFRGRADEFKMVKVDRRFHNTTTTQQLRVPVYSEEPPVGTAGQLYYDSTLEQLCYSTDIDTWVCINVGNVAGDLFVMGNGEICGDLKVKGDANLCSDLDVVNDTTICGNLIVKKTTCLENVKVDELTANTANVVGDTIICGNLTVKGNTTIKGDLMVFGNINGNIMPMPDVTLDCVGTITDGNCLVVNGISPNLTIKRIKAGENIEFDEIANSICINANITSFNNKLVLDEVCANEITVNEINVDCKSTLNNLSVTNKSLLNSVCANKLTVTSDSSLCGSVLINCEESYEPVLDWNTLVYGPGSEIARSITAENNAVYGSVIFTTSANVTNANGSIAEEITGTGGSCLAKWDISGDVEWAAKTGDTASDTIEDLGSDLSSVTAIGRFDTTINIYNQDETIGNTLSSSGVAGFVSKWDVTGNVDWAAKIENTSSRTPRGVLVDSDSIYVIGDAGSVTSFYNSDGSLGKTSLGGSGYLSKWSSDGFIDWIAEMDTTGIIINNVKIFSDSCSVYGTGYFRDSISFLDSSGTLQKVMSGQASFNTAYVSSYDNFGNFNWSTKVEQNSSTVQGLDVIADANFVYAIGTFSGASVDVYNADGTVGATISGGTTNNLYVAKFDSNGTVIWATKMRGTAGTPTASIQIKENTVIVSGIGSSGLGMFNADGTLFVSSSGIATHGFTARWNSDGEGQWLIYYVNGGTSQTIDLKVNDNGEIYSIGDTNVTTDLVVTVRTATATTTLGTLTGFGQGRSFVLKLPEILDSYQQKDANAVLQICSNTIIDNDTTICGNLTVKGNITGNSVDVFAEAGGINLFTTGSTHLYGATFRSSVITSATILTASDSGSFYAIDASSGAYSITLPLASNGLNFIFLLAIAGNDITITSPGGGTNIFGTTLTGTPGLLVASGETNVIIDSTAAPFATHLEFLGVSPGTYLLRAVTDVDASISYT